MPSSAFHLKRDTFARDSASHRARCGRDRSRRRHTRATTRECAYRRKKRRGRWPASHDDFVIAASHMHFGGYTRVELAALMPEACTQTETRDACIARLEIENYRLRQHLMYADTASLCERSKDATLRELHLAQQALIKMRARSSTRGSGRGRRRLKQGKTKHRTERHRWLPKTTVQLLTRRPRGVLN